MGYGHSTSSFLFRIHILSRNSCFEITSVRGFAFFFAYPSPPLLHMPQSNPLLLAVASDVQFIQTHNLTPDVSSYFGRSAQTLHFNSSLNVSSFIWHWVFIATGAWYFWSLRPQQNQKTRKIRFTISFIAALLQCIKIINSGAPARAKKSTMGKKIW